MEPFAKHLPTTGLGCYKYQRSSYPNRLDIELSEQRLFPPGRLYHVRAIIIKSRFTAEAWKPRFELQYGDTAIWWYSIPSVNSSVSSVCRSLGTHGWNYSGHN